METRLRTGRQCSVPSTDNEGNFFLRLCAQAALRPIQSTIQRIQGALTLGGKGTERESDHPPPSSAEVKNAMSHTHTQPIRLHGVVLS
jgi:hypothetical protein